jgi:large subunit ribosomal protein L7/L12
MAMTKDQLIDEIKGMSVLELADLVKALEEEFGVSAAAATVAVAAPGGAAGGGDGAPAAEEKTEFDVVLTNAGSSKIPVIKVIRSATGLGLKEAKEIADAAPKAVKEGITRDEAEKIKASVEEQGGKVEIK